jgi:DNA-binding SARP family transcriptional activator/tetratricopeptide (TPR) repeat protein
LAVLLLGWGRPVSVEDIAGAVWEEAVPPTARSTIRTYVHRLRRVVGGSVIVSRGGGYAVAVEGVLLDVVGFRRLLSDAVAARGRGELAVAVRCLREALEVGRGEALAGLSGRFVEGQRLRLRQEWVGVLEGLAGLEFELGDGGELVGELEGVVAEEPLRERLRELLMLGLYRSGRQAEALAVFERVRVLLRDELGVDPGPGLRELHQRILIADPGLLAPTHLIDHTPADEPVAGDGVGETATQAAVSEPSATPVGVGVTRAPAQLPIDLPVFVGRQEEFTSLRGSLVGGEGGASAGVVGVICGMGGMGKTTLAVHWAHRVADRFPDGQVFVNLRGFDVNGAAMDPMDAIREILDAFGVAPQDSSMNVASLSALYRTVLAERKLLIVLDNARDSEQVVPLLPGGPNSLVLVTSRSRLSGLVAATGARTVVLDALSIVEAQEFLRCRLGAERIAAEPEAVRDIVTLSGGLPLALAVVAAHAAGRPGFMLSTVGDELSASRDSLDAFADVDGLTDLRAVFSWSYRALSAPAARLFRLLALCPGTSTTVLAAASLIGLPLRVTKVLLRELDSASLWVESAPSRYSCHDLLRLYGAELVQDEDDESEQRAALHRLLDHYLHTAYRATKKLSGTRNMFTLPDFVDGALPYEPVSIETAMAWLTLEYPALLMLINWADASGFTRHVWQIAWSIRLFQTHAFHMRDLGVVQQLALDAARRSDDQIGMAYAHSGMGVAKSKAEPKVAMEHIRESIALYGNGGDDVGMAFAYCQLSGELYGRGDYVDSITECERGLALFRSAGEPVGEALALNQIGEAKIKLGQYEEPLAYFRQCLAIPETAEAPYLTASTWEAVGYANEQRGHYSESADGYEHAVAIYRKTGGRSLPLALDDLGRVYAAMGRNEEADAAIDESNAIKTKSGWTDLPPHRA